MALFRFQRGSLEESLKTTIIVNNINDLLERIIKELNANGLKGEKESIGKYGIEIGQHQSFDNRCGWYTHLVSCRIGNGNFFAIGFLSEPLDEWRAYCGF
jgi:hypothetical protein